MYFLFSVIEWADLNVLHTEYAEYPAIPRPFHLHVLVCFEEVTRYSIHCITIVAILFQCHANKWQGILQLSHCCFALRMPSPPQ